MFVAFYNTTFHVTIQELLHEVSVTQVVGEKWEKVEQEVMLILILVSQGKYLQARVPLPYPARICIPAGCGPASSCVQWLARSHCSSKGFGVQTERNSNLTNVHSNAEGGRAVAPSQSEPDSAKTADQAIVSRAHTKTCSHLGVGGRSIDEFLPAPTAIL